MDRANLITIWEDPLRKPGGTDRLNGKVFNGGQAEIDFVLLM